MSLRLSDLFCQYTWASSTCQIYEFNYIAIPKSNVLQSESKDLLFESVGELNESFSGIEEVLTKMIVAKCPNPTFSMSYFDLFTFGLTNTSRQIFFSMSVATDIAECSNETEFGLSVGESEHDFLYSYVKFLVSEKLVKVDFADFLIDWKARMIQPIFLAPLTSRGRLLLSLIQEKEKLFFGTGAMLLTTERLIRIMDIDDDSTRYFRARLFASKIK